MSLTRSRAAKHSLPDPAAAPARCNDDVFDAGAQYAVGHCTGETDQLCADRWGAVHHAVYLLRRALGPPLCRTVEREYPIRRDRPLGVREDNNHISVIHRDRLSQIFRPTRRG